MTACRVRGAPGPSHRVVAIPSWAPRDSVAVRWYRLLLAMDEHTTESGASLDAIWALVHAGHFQEASDRFALVRAAYLRRFRRPTKETNDG